MVITGSLFFLILLFTIVCYVICELSLMALTVKNPFPPYYNTTCKPVLEGFWGFWQSMCNILTHKFFVFFVDNSSI